MDWFEKLTGFCETSYDDTKTKLEVDGSRLQSMVNGKSYGIGELELVSLQALRERVKSAGGLPGCSPPCTDQTGKPSLRGLLLPGFQRIGLPCMGLFLSRSFSRAGPSFFL